MGSQSLNKLIGLRVVLHTVSPGGLLLSPLLQSYHTATEKLRGVFAEIGFFRPDPQVFFSPTPYHG